jgi:hypothetical protein
MTLTQVLASIAILALPVGLYATELRGISGRRPDMVLFTESLVAHCVELEAFLWLILAPCIGAFLTRWRAPQPVPGNDDGDSTEGWTDLLLPQGLDQIIHSAPQGGPVVGGEKSIVVALAEFERRHPRRD